LRRKEGIKLRVCRIKAIKRGGEKEGVSKEKRQGEKSVKNRKGLRLKLRFRQEGYSLRKEKESNVSSQPSKALEKKKRDFERGKSKRATKMLVRVLS